MTRRRDEAEHVRGSAEVRGVSVDGLRAREMARAEVDAGRYRVRCGSRGAASSASGQERRQCNAPDDTSRPCRTRSHLHVISPLSESGRRVAAGRHSEQLRQNATPLIEGIPRQSDSGLRRNVRDVRGVRRGVALRTQRLVRGCGYPVQQDVHDHTGDGHVDPDREGEPGDAAVLGEARAEGELQGAQRERQGQRGEQRVARQHRQVKGAERTRPRGSGARR